MPKNNCLIISASPRAGSNSALAADFLASMINPKPNISNKNINKLRFKACNACDKCRDSLKCVFNDDADMLIKKIGKADIVIVASPVYFTGVPGPLKTFIDRNQVQWYIRLRQGSGVRAAITNPKSQIPKKKGIIILTQGTKKDKYFRPAESEIRSFFAVNNIKTAAVLKFKGMDEKGKILRDKKALALLKSAAL
jgi:multimeric flavodoxin WrbA